MKIDKTGFRSVLVEMDVHEDSRLSDRVCIKTAFGYYDISKEADGSLVVRVATERGEARGACVEPLSSNHIRILPMPSRGVQ